MLQLTEWVARDVTVDGVGRQISYTTITTLGYSGVEYIRDHGKLFFRMRNISY